MISSKIVVTIRCDNEWVRRYGGLDHPWGCVATSTYEIDVDAATASGDRYPDFDWIAAAASRSFTERGWHFDGDRSLCPACERFGKDPDPD
jgi:hypothetical protein